jgi:hypothetical protein
MTTTSLNEAIQNLQAIADNARPLMGSNFHYNIYQLIDLLKSIDAGTDPNTPIEIWGGGVPWNRLIISPLSLAEKVGEASALNYLVEHGATLEFIDHRNDKDLYFKNTDSSEEPTAYDSTESLVADSVDVDLDF